MAYFLLLLLNLLLLLFLLLHTPSSTAQTYKNITIGTTLTPNGPTSSWLSPSGDFAFGFAPHPANSSLFLLAVWFAKIAEKTIVWYANGDAPADANSVLQFNSDGQLILTDVATKTTLWSINAPGVSYAAILDTGNFVLATADFAVKWQTFTIPTDTILPTQVLYPTTVLWSHLTDTDYSNGRFKMIMQIDGNLVMYPVALPTPDTYEAYWNSYTVNVGLRLVFDSSGNIYVAGVNNTRINVTSSSLQTVDFYQRATLDPDGVFRQYVHPKDPAKSNGWANGWTVVGFQPPDICRASGVLTGSGVCGFNSYCQLDQNQRAQCVCPTMYSFIDAGKPYLGCMPDFVVPSCGGGGEEYLAASFELIELINTDWPYADYERYMEFNEAQCRENCLQDCFCMVAIFRGTYCWKKKYPLSNGKVGSYVGGKALVKVSKLGTNSSSPSFPPGSSSRRSPRVWILVGTLPLAVSLIVFVASIVFTVLSRRKRGARVQFESSIGGVNLPCFTYEELEDATNGFGKEIGKGAFGTVYAGFLPSDTKVCVAVKKLDRLFLDKEKEFVAEVRSISQTHHKNLVKLFGYCNQGPNRLLVYEFMSNGSLTNLLFGGQRLSWAKRIEVAIGIARGLLYLHEECATQIIHCDIKPQNILLDDELTPRISDFGLAKLLNSDQTRTTTGIRGTRGYVAPEWFRNAAITAKVDVYSYGVMLLEIVTCRRSLEKELENGGGVEVLVFWAYDCFKEGRVDLLVADDGEASADLQRVRRLVMVAIWCIQEDPGRRPTMRRVNHMLDEVFEVPVPPDPSSEKVLCSPDCYKPLLG